MKGPISFSLSLSPLPLSFPYPPSLSSWSRLSLLSPFFHLAPLSLPLLSLLSLPLYSRLSLPPLAVTPCTIHHTPCTIHPTTSDPLRPPTPSTSKSYTVHRTPCTTYTIHYSPYIIHHTPYGSDLHLPLWLFALSFIWEELGLPKREREAKREYRGWMMGVGVEREGVKCEREEREKWER